MGGSSGREAVGLTGGGSSSGGGVMEWDVVEVDSRLKTDEEIIRCYVIQS